MADYGRQQHFSHDGGLPVWGPRERGGYWRLYKASRRAEDVAERVNNWAADSSRAAGTGNTSSQPVSEAVGKGTSSKTTSGTSA